MVQNLPSQAPQFGGWFHILVPVRGGADAITRLQLSLKIAAGTGARVTALYVVDDRLLADPEAGLVRDALVAQLNAEGQKLLSELELLAADEPVKLRTRLEQGEVVSAILRVADELSADAIVVGAHKKTWLGRLLGGSLAESLLNSAKCTVIAVPPGAERF